jgi:hypothetical protein
LLAGLVFLRPVRCRIVSHRCLPASSTEPIGLGGHFDNLAEGPIAKSNRGDKTAIELFIAGVQGWEAGLRRRMDDSKSKPD